MTSELRDEETGQAIRWACYQCGGSKLAINGDTCQRCDGSGVEPQPVARAAANADILTKGIGQPSNQDPLKAIPPGVADQSTKSPPPSSVASRPQPPPSHVASGPNVWEMIIGEIGREPNLASLIPLMKERDAFGRAKYGVALRPDNGRDHLADLMQEALDASVYARSAILAGEDNTWTWGAYATALKLCREALRAIEAREILGGKPDGP